MAAQGGEVAVEPRAGELRIRRQAQDPVVEVDGDVVRPGDKVEVGVETTEPFLITEGQVHWLGDLTIDAEGTVYTTDSWNRVIYRLKIEASEIEYFLTDSDFGSLQGLDISADGKTLFVADYATGIFAVDLESRKVTRLNPGASVVPYGIDGLYVHGQSLIAIQNGVRPQRLIRLNLDQNLTRVDSLKVLEVGHPAFFEPTLGDVVGNTFYYVANSAWPLFSDESNMPPPPFDAVPNPVILKLMLD